MEKNQKKEILIFIIISLILVSVTGCLEVPVLKVNVNVSINTTEGKPEIKDVIATQTSVDVLSRPRDQPANFPGLYCRVLTQTGNAWSAKSFWSSVPYTGAGSYELIVDFEKPPVKGENLRLWIAVYGEQGRDALASGYTPYAWK